MDRPVIADLLVGMPRTFGSEGATDPFDRPWTSAICKERVDGPVWLSREGLAGDGVADRKVHGGPDKAVLASATEHLPFWRELLERDELEPGAFGENLGLRGLVEADVCIGDVFVLGGAKVEVSQPRQPCWKQARRWRRKELALDMQRSGRTGWYFRVIEEGFVAAGDELVCIERPWPAWTVARANAVMHGRPVDADAARALSQVGALAPGWRESLARLAAGAGGDGKSRLVGPNEG